MLIFLRICEFMLTVLSGSYAILKGEPKPQGKQNDSLIKYDVTTSEVTVYKYISRDWREL